MFKNNMTHKDMHRSSSNNVLETNPLNNTWEIIRFNCTAGPENIWKCYDCERRGDRKPGTIFIFEKRSVEKLHKPKRKETITEILRSSIRQLERFKHPKILQIYTSLEECSETIAFISEPIITNLSNLFNKEVTHYNCINIEVKYGLLQLTEALQYLHCNCRIIHRNICPNSIFITRRCTWKLSGFEFIEKIETESDTIQIQPWTSRLPKMAQPNLDFTPPEVQFDSTCSIYSDLFSLGLIILYIHNHGKIVLASNHSTSNYIKATEAFETEIKNIIHTIPSELQEALLRLLSREPRLRPTSQLLTLSKYFTDPSVHTLQFLDIINMKDVNTKNNFYKSTLLNNLEFIPKKLWFQHIWPVLQHEMNGQEVLASVLQPIIYIINECSSLEFNKYILPSFKNIFQLPKSIQATVTLLENLHIILGKIELNELENQSHTHIKNDIFSMLHNSLDSITIQVQNASLIAIGTIPSNNFDTISIRKIILPKVKLIYNNNTVQGTQQDIRLIYNVLICVENIIEFLIDRNIIIEDVLPILQDCSKLTDPDINLIVVRIYKVLLTNKKYGLTINLLATRVLPTLIPQTVNPNLNLEQFTTLILILNDMLEYINKNQRNKLKLDNNISSLQLLNKSSHPTGISTSLNMIKHQRSTDNIKIENSMTSFKIDSSERKATSTENIITGSARKASINVFGENFLRVITPNSSQQSYRRLSDNTLMGNSSPMVPPTIKICSSSLLGNNIDNDTNLPTRRHSSICSQERKNSVATLAASSSASSRVKNFAQASASASAVNSRRNSFLQPGQLFQQIGTGMFQLFNSGK